MIQAHDIYPAFYFCYYHTSSTSTIRRYVPGAGTPGLDSLYSSAGIPVLRASPV